VENFIQDEIFDANLPQMRDQGEKAASVIKIPPTPSSNGAEVKVIRSTRRKKSISAYRQAGAIVISVPARLSKSEVRQVIPEMVSKVLSLEAREKIGEEDLYKRSLELLTKYLPECPVKPLSVTWRSMSERWGSCTTVERSIRISERLNGAPGYVLDYLLVHELIHLMIADHGPDFEALLARFELGKEACAYLEGYEAGVRAGK